MLKKLFKNKITGFVFRQSLCIDMVGGKFKVP